MQFVSKYNALRVQVVEDQVGMSANGHPIVLRNARYAEFVHGQFATSNFDIITALVTHPSYGRDFYGPFSIDEVRSGRWRDLIKPEELQPQESTVKVDLAKVLQKTQKENPPVKVIDGMVNTKSGQEDTVVPVKDILKHQAEQDKKLKELKK
jgi:hypothetical protein